MRFFEIEPYNHKQKYVIKKSLQSNGTGIQQGSGIIDALSKAATVAGKIASNPAVQSLGKAGLEVGTVLAGHAIANKLANDGHTNAAQTISAVTANPSETLSALLKERDRLKEMYKNGEITKADAISMIKKIDAMRQSGGVAALRCCAKQQVGRGNVMSIRPVKYRPAVMPPNYSLGHIDPASINTSSGLQTGGIGPVAIAGIAAALPLLASLISPVIEKVSSKFMVPALPGLGD